LGIGAILEFKVLKGTKEKLGYRVKQALKVFKVILVLLVFLALQVFKE
jgi:hypothetical protein